MHNGLFPDLTRAEQKSRDKCSPYEPINVKPERGGGAVGLPTGI